jgi:prolipoprotein diacylglyceryltransferase
MVGLTFATGGALILTGVVGFVATGATHPTALIPAVFGGLIVAAAAVATKGGKAKMHATHAALVVALLGLLGTAKAFFKLPSLLLGTAERPAAVLAQSVTALVCLGFLVVAIRSFIAARKAREAA